MLRHAARRVVLTEESLLRFDELVEAVLRDPHLGDVGVDAVAVPEQVEHWMPCTPSSSRHHRMKSGISLRFRALTMPLM